MSDESLPFLHDPANWQYIGEGGRSVVFAYVGPAHVAALVRRVLRVAKIGAAGGERGVRASVRLAQSLAHSWLGPDAVPDMRLVEVTRPFVTGLCTASLAHRPPHRVHAGLDPAVSVAILMPNLLARLGSGRVVTMEIKPKCGFLSVITATGAPLPVCQFSLHERLHQRISQYCPLDLFSGQKDRVQRALEALVAQPENKLRVFVDGKLVLSQELRDKHPVSADLLAGAGVAETLCATVTRHLCASGLLPRLLALQAVARPYLWAAYHGPVTDLDDDEGEEGEDEEKKEHPQPRSEFVPDFCCACQELSFAAQVPPPLMPPRVASSPPPGLTAAQRALFLVGRSAMDCSLMVTFDEDGAAQVQVIDLDVKSARKLPAYQQQNRAFLEILKGQVS